MFNSIVESVFNEITAKDAYERYYTNMASDEYFYLVNLYGKFDNFMKMVMNDLKDGNCSYDEAVELVKKYVSAPNNVRAEFSRRFSGGGIESVGEAAIEIDMLLSIGNVSEKDLYMAGYSVLLDNDKYKITCTTTYAANHHFFGKTRWCTASDRKGRFDGWYMFLNYTYMIDTDDNDFYDEFDANNVYACLFQCLVKTGENKGLYQMQVLPNGRFGQICDSNDQEDYNIKGDDFVRDVIRKNLGSCVEDMKKNVAIEAKYYQSIDFYEKKRIGILKVKNRKKINTLLKKANKYNFNKAQFVVSKFNEVLKSNLLKNYDFVTEIIYKYEEYINSRERNDERFFMEYEKFLSTHGYLSPGSSYYNETSKFIFCRLSPIFGVFQDVFEDNIKYTDSKIENKFRESQGFKVNNLENQDESVICDSGVYVIINKESKQVVSVTNVDGFLRASMTTVFLGRYDSSLREYLLLGSNNVFQIINIENGEKIQLPHEVFKCCENHGFTYRKYGDYFIFGSYPGSSLSLWGIADLNKKEYIGTFYCSHVNEDFLLISNEHGCYFLKCGTGLSKISYKPSFEISEDALQYSNISVGYINDNNKTIYANGNNKTIIYITNKNEKKVDIYDLGNDSIIEYGADITKLEYDYNKMRFIVTYISKDGTEKTI